MSQKSSADGARPVDEQHPARQIDPGEVIAKANANQSNKPVSTVRCVLCAELLEAGPLDTGTPEQRRRAFSTELARAIEEGAFANVSLDEPAFDLAGREPTAPGRARYIIELVFDEEWPNSDRSAATHRAVLAKTLLEALDAGFFAEHHCGPVTISVPSRTVLQTAAAGDPDDE